MKVISYIKNPIKIIQYIFNKGYLNFIPDSIFLKMKYKLEMGKKLNLDNPQTFNEKLQWLKLNDRKDIYTTMVDKYAVKEYVGNIIGNEYIIPTLGVYDKFDDINFDELPKQFVMKCTHDSGTVVICKDKKNFDIKKARKKINKYLKRKYYYIHREWPYKNVKPRIIIEEFMEDDTYKELRDYKVYAFNGKCDYVMLCFDRFKADGTKFIYFDKNWNIKKEFSKDGLKYGNNIKVERPKNLKTMFELASKLSKGIKFVRVDFYEVNGKLYFGELTFFPSAGLDNTRTQAVNEYLDNELILDGVNNEND